MIFSIYDPNIGDNIWRISSMKIPRTDVLAVSTDGSRLLTTTLEDLCFTDTFGSSVAQVLPGEITISNFLRQSPVASHNFANIALPSRLKSTIYLFNAHTRAEPDLKNSKWGAKDKEH